MVVSSCWLKAERQHVSLQMSLRNPGLSSILLVQNLLKSMEREKRNHIPSNMVVSQYHLSQSEFDGVPPVVKQVTYLPATVMTDLCVCEGLK